MLHRRKDILKYELLLFLELLERVLLNHWRCDLCIGEWSTRRAAVCIVPVW